MFEPAPQQLSFPKLEESILQFWKEKGIYQKSLDQREGAPPFVFYEGPPTANGMPHPGHCLTRAIKDLFPRYRTMRGYRCDRKAGWDTHGLPVEVEVCKELGIHSKEEIEAFGIEPFIQKCQKSVWRYMQEWEQLTERLGFWIHLEEAYVTYHQSYVESVWWSLKNLFDRGLLYQGHKIVWWWAQGGTALSAGEVGQGYREVDDPSLFVQFPLLDEEGAPSDTAILVWTTTPWTLPSNQFAAVHPDLDYATVIDVESGQKLILAAALVETVASKSKRELNVVSTCKGAELVGRRYLPPFDYFYKTEGDLQGKLLDGSSEYKSWRIVSADFVTTESGSGAVHQAPAFGEVDYEVLVSEQARFAKGEGPTLINAVSPDGKFTDEAPDYAGRWVKECDKEISRNLRERGLLFYLEQYRHDYPFCWRAEQDPLIQYPRESWFVRTTSFKDQMLQNNGEINWMPEHIREGRFGNFLASNVDWALSRERYWGTPLPIWVCDKTGEKEAIANYDELLAKPGIAGTEVWEEAKGANPDLPDDLRVHKPYIDAITYDSPFAEGAPMRRVTEVIDCWYDSGAMPFAQWGYPQLPESENRFKEQFPADFISEALDQTRGWFYSQLAISTMLFGESTLPAESENQEKGGTALAPTGDSAVPFPHPFRNCIVLGLMLGEDGAKMSKSKRNYRAPDEIFDLYGADALRWYFFANQPPWTSIRYSERAIKDSIPRFLLTLWNCYTFFLIYANSADRFDPSERIDGDVDQLGGDTLSRGTGYRDCGERSELDRWVMSELQITSAQIVEKMDAYDNYGACRQLDQFVDNLSNWYVRRSRDRFWSKEYDSQDKQDAYWTLYECLIATCKLAAPFVPFLAEALWQNLAGIFKGRAVESVHLCDYPTGEADKIDKALSEQMELARLVSSLGREARAKAKLKVRQPLAKVEVILADQTHQPWLESHSAVVASELNVKEVEFTDEIEKYIDHEVVPNFKLLGPKLGKNMPKVKAWLNSQSGPDLLANFRDNGKLDFTIDGQTIELTREEVEVRIQAKEGWTAANGEGCVVVLATELSPELLREGIARDLVRLIQDQRKSMDCQYTDRISVSVQSPSEELNAAIEENREYIEGEVLAVEINSNSIQEGQAVELSIGEDSLTLSVKVVSA